MSREILSNPRAPHITVFDDDFDEVAEYFADITVTRSWSALPGGVNDTFVPSSNSYEPLILDADQFRGYRVDVDHYIANDKKIIAGALSLLEARQLDDKDFTLCPSVSVGLLIILMALKREGVRTIVAELPAYFACVEQALLLDFRVLLLPTLAREGFIITPIDLQRICLSVDAPMAIFITQPRYGMGFCRDIGSVMALRTKLRPGDAIVIDEAADQGVPSNLGSLALEGDVTVLRTRGLMKGLGLNSARVAAIFHPRRLRPLFGELVDLAGGALDAASLLLVTRLLSEPARYADLLFEAQRYVRQQNKILGDLLRGLPVSLSPIESGYIGTAHIFFPNTDEPLAHKRTRFLKCCRSHQMPVVLGSSMYFPYSGDREIIRINYFTSEQNIRASAAVLERVIQALKLTS